MPTLKQLWARERNWNKARLVAMLHTARNMAYQQSTTPKEAGKLIQIAAFLSGELKGFKKREDLSRSLFLDRRKNAKR